MPGAPAPGLLFALVPRCRCGAPPALLPLTLPSPLPFSSGSAVRRLTSFTQESLAFNTTAGQAGAARGGV